MTLSLPRPGAQYDMQNEAATRQSIERSDSQNMKVGAIFEKIRMRDTVTGAIVTLTVASGSLVIT